MFIEIDRKEWSFDNGTYRNDASVVTYRHGGSVFMRCVSYNCNVKCVGWRTSDGRVMDEDGSCTMELKYQNA